MSVPAINAAPVIQQTPAPIPAPSPAQDAKPDTRGVSSATKTPDRPHDGDSDDETTVPSSPVARTSSGAQTALAALKVGG